MRAIVVMLVLAGLAGCAQTTEDPGGTQLEKGMFLIEGVVVTEAIVPLEGAVVSSVDGDLKNTTDSDGRFTLGPVEAGFYNLRINAHGFAEQSVRATVRDGSNEALRVVMDAVNVAEPYHATVEFSGYLECTFDTWVAPYQILGAPCLGLIDLVTGVQVSQDEWQFVWSVDDVGFEAVQIEMVWDEQTTGSQMGLLLRNVAGAGSGVDAGGTDIDTQYFSNRSASPMQVWVYQGIENPGADSGAVFQEHQNETGNEYKILILGRADYDQQADVHLMLQNRPQLFVTKFYNGLDEAFSVIDGA